MILDEIAACTRQRVTEQKRRQPLAEVMAKAAAAAAQTALPAGPQTALPAPDAAGAFAFERALRRSCAADGVAFICEVKKASPSRGVIAADYPYLDFARDYEAAGAAAISVLTEPFYFQGCDRHLAEIARQTGIPVLRKDFTVDPYQIYEARVLGASAVLLICALLETAALREYIGIAHSLGLSALVEAHTAPEVQSAVRAGARIIGVNNRNLQTFQVDLGTSRRLRPLVPPASLFVSESGIRTAGDIAALLSIGTDAVLIGEAFMQSPDKRQQLAVLRAGAKPAERSAP